MAATVCISKLRYVRTQTLIFGQFGRTLRSRTSTSSARRLIKSTSTTSIRPVTFITRYCFALSFYAYSFLLI
jgi:hypothetical protein